MSTAPLPPPGRLRPLNVVRDLGGVANLVELCFYQGLDRDGQQALQDMRRASRDPGMLRWTPAAGEALSMPLTGYVWEADGKVVGNVSLIPFRQDGRRIYLIANVAVHPDLRRRGIGRALTEQAMQHARLRNPAALWLHVRDDNPGAIRMYEQLGFEIRLLRATWQATADPAAAVLPGWMIGRRPWGLWRLQRRWLTRLHPPETDWYRPVAWDALSPGPQAWLHRLFIDYDLRQWAARRARQPQAVLSWLPARGHSDALWAALAPDADPSALTALLLHARRQGRPRRALQLELPDGLYGEAIQAAGFEKLRTLVWMRASGAAPGG